MAQLQQENGSKLNGVFRRLGRRPHLFTLMVVCVLVAILVVGAGIAMANKSSITIDRGSSVSGTTGAASSDSASVESDVEVDKKSSDKNKDTDEVVVDVSGAVVSPSVVCLSEGDRIDDAITACGGLSDDADIDGVNRASVLVDGQKVYIPHRGEAQDSTMVDGVQVAQGASAEASSGSSGLVNIDSASSEELQTLSGVGPSTAQAIIDERTQNGAFATVDDLMRVSGIGEKKLAKIKDSICV